jgi:hypothetical protein
VDLEADDAPAFTDEPYMPPASQVEQRVEFYYRTSAKPQDYWKEESQDWNKQADAFLGRKRRRPYCTTSCSVVVWVVVPETAFTATV